MKDLVIKLTGQITDSNFDQWKGELISQIKSANKDLATDGDFVEAEETVKQFKFAEKSLVEAKQSALEQAADIQKLFSAIDEISDEARQARLSLEKQIKVRKTQIKADLINEYYAKAENFYDSYMDSNKDFYLVRPNLFNESMFADALNRKKTIESMQKALTELLDDIGETVKAEATKIFSNREVLDGVSSDFKPLFQDERALLSMDWEVLEVTIKQRISTFEAEEAKRKAAKLERDQQERERKEAEEIANQQASIDTPTQEVVTEQKENSAQGAEGRSNSQDRPSLKEAIGESLDDDETSQPENFILTVAITGTKDDAKQIAIQINELIGSNNNVVNIKLSQESQQAAA